jgi:multisubunit Na+/H+ antiporter MnhE subunit
LQHSTQSGATNTAAWPPCNEEIGLLPRLYASRLGPRSRAYYLRQFARFDALDKGLPSWNAAAGFFTLAWCCLRGLWVEAGRYLACVIIAALAWWWGIQPFMPAAMAYGVAAALWLAAVAVPGLMGNAWLWRQVRAQTLRTITGSATMAEAHEKLAAQATTPRRQILAGLVAALPLAAAAGATAAWLTAQRNTAPSEAVSTTPQPASTRPAR